MQFKGIFIWLLIFIVGSLIVTFLVSPDSFKDFKTNVGKTISSINLNTKVDNSVIESNFKCEEELGEWLREEKIKLSSSTSVEVIEKKSFTNKTELLGYIDKWGALNEYETKKYINEITKIEEEPINFTYEIKRGKDVIKLIYSFSKEDVNSVTLKVKKYSFVQGSEIVCEKTSEESSGEILCDLSEFGDGDYRAEAFRDEIEKQPKVWEGRIDVVLIKEEGEINNNDVSILVIGVCKEEGKLIFNSVY